MKSPSKLVIVDFTEKAKSEQCRKPEFSSPEDLIRYLARLEAGADEDRDQLTPLLSYVTDDERAVEMRVSGFHSFSFEGMAEELRQDMAAARTSSVLRHGTMSTSVSANDRPDMPAKLLQAGATLMQLLGVDKNRYVLVAHTDTDHVHLHYLYSRVDGQGRVRERDAKFRQYLLEEACAVVAHRHGFGLEPGHHARADEHGVVDTVSGQRVRNARFESLIGGCKARNEARRQLSTGHPLEATALLALNRARGSFARFAAILAESGITYEKSGSGAALVDAEGVAHRASKVNYRLSIGRVCEGACKDGIPDIDPAIKALAESRRAAIGEVEPGAEWSRFAQYHEGGRELQEQDRRAAEKWDSDVKRAFHKDRRGRPAGGRSWNSQGTTTSCVGGFGSPTWRGTPASHFDAQAFQVIDQRWQTEVWRGGEMIASIRYSRMAITSNKEEDLRAALLAAHKAWGRVEVFGNAKFKRQIVALAAELNIELSNPELQRPLQIARVKMEARRVSSPDRRNMTASPASKTNMVATLTSSQMNAAAFVVGQIDTTTDNARSGTHETIAPGSHANLASKAANKAKLVSAAVREAPAAAFKQAVQNATDQRQDLVELGCRHGRERVRVQSIEQGTDGIRWAFRHHRQTRPIFVVEANGDALAAAMALHRAPPPRCTSPPSRSAAPRRARRLCPTASILLIFLSSRRRENWCQDRASLASSWRQSRAFQAWAMRCRPLMRTAPEQCVPQGEGGVHGRAPVALRHKRHRTSRSKEGGQ